MPNIENFDLEYRPHSYWGPQNLRTHYGGRIKGELRRAVALSQLEEGEAHPAVLQSALDEDSRQAAGRIHPWFMGGEYLPDLAPDEVEIARITMKSTTMDVIGIRARRQKRRIAYRFVDVYEDLIAKNYEMQPETSAGPLTLGEVIHVIDLNRLIDGPRARNYASGLSTAEKMHDFCTASSSFYPEFARWYDEANDEWLAKEVRKREKMEPDQ